MFFQVLYNKLRVDKDIQDEKDWFSYFNCFRLLWHVFWKPSRLCSSSVGPFLKRVQPLQCSRKTTGHGEVLQLDSSTLLNKQWITLHMACHGNYKASPAIRHNGAVFLGGRVQEAMNLVAEMSRYKHYCFKVCVPRQHSSAKWQSLAGGGGGMSSLKNHRIK